MSEENLYRVTVTYRVRAEDRSMAEYKIRTSGYEIEGIEEPVRVEIITGEERPIVEVEDPRTETEQVESEA